jgi:hypothetical protein
MSGHLRCLVTKAADDIFTRVVEITPELLDRYTMISARDRERESTSPSELPQEPCFYLSYASVPDDSPVEMRGWEHRFFSDLNAQLSGLTRSAAPGVGTFVVGDTGWAGRSHQEQMKDGLSRARVFVPLYSPRYFKSAWCGMEWDAFGRRQHEEQRAHGYMRSAIVPVLWDPVGSSEIPRAAAALQYMHPYTEGGLLHLLESGRTFRYERAVREIAETIVEVAEATRLRSCDPELFDDLHNIFEGEER